MTDSDYIWTELYESVTQWLSQSESLTVTLIVSSHSDSHTNTIHSIIHSLIRVSSVLLMLVSSQCDCECPNYSLQQRRPVIGAH